MGAERHCKSVINMKLENESEYIDETWKRREVHREVKKHIQDSLMSLECSLSVSEVSLRWKLLSSSTCEGVHLTES